MNQILSLHTLGVYLGTSSEMPISLKELIAQQFDGNQIPCDIALTITVAPSIVVTLIDDLTNMPACAGNAVITQRIEFVLHRYSQLVYTNVVATTKDQQQHALFEKELIVQLKGKSAQATLHCSCYGAGNSVYTFKTLQNHCAEKTKSCLVIKGVLDDSAKISCNNLIKVTKNAKGVVADQINKNLLLNKQAKVISVPQLEIENNNAQCHHGAAVSNLNQEHLFYLQSRGLSHAACKQIMIDSFLSI